MATFPLALGTQSNPGRSPLEGVARLINLRIEVGGDEQRVKYTAQSVAGLTDLCTLAGSGGVRAAVEMDGVGIALAGRVISQFEVGGTSNVLGGMPSDGFPTMAVNDRATGKQCIVVCDGLAKYVEGGSLIEITDPDVGQPNSVCFSNGHFVTSSVDGNLRASDLNEASSWDGLDNAKAQVETGGQVRVVSKGRQIVSFGRKFHQIWDYNPDTTGTGFPFTPVQTDVPGCLSAASVISAAIVNDNLVTETLAWVGTDPKGGALCIVMLDGYVARKISTFAVDRDIGRCEDPTTIDARTWTIDGHSYIAWTIPGVTTWVYDTTTSKWHERQSYGYGHWIGGPCMVLSGRIVVGDHASPKLYLMDRDVCTEGTLPLVVTLQTPPLHGYPNQIEINALYLDCQTGVGLNTTTPADLDPRVMMRMSRDGETWGTELSRALGRLGHGQARAAWHALGTTDHRGMSFRFSASAAVVRSLMMAQIDGKKIKA